MPRNPKYPLEGLLEHRERKVDDATVELGSAVREREDAEVARGRAEMAKREAEARAATVRSGEANHLARGELRAVDLSRAEAWEVAVRAELSHLSRAVEHARGQAEGARVSEARARDELAQKKADQDVVAKDKGRFAIDRGRALEAAEEQSVDEAWRGDRRAR